MNGAVLHARTREALEYFAQNPGHALLLTGNQGSGKTFVALGVAAELLGVPWERLSGQPYFSLVAPQKNALSIDAIRNLQRFMQLKTPGARPIRRVALIEHAHTMSVEAQNALLKLLEEPPADSVLILTAHHPRMLLPTIRSRVQTVTLQTPGAEALKQHFAAQAATPEAYTQAYFLSGGAPGLLHALLSDDAAHPLAAAIQQAKTLLQTDTFGRLAQVDVLAKQKDTAAITLEALMRIAGAALDQAAAKAQPAALKRWHHILKLSAEAAAALEQNASAKLVFTNLMLQL